MKNSLLCLHGFTWPSAKNPWRNPPHLKEEDMNTIQLINDIKTLSAQIKELKKKLRTPWERMMAAEQMQLDRLKRRITPLMCLRAHLRGKTHLSQNPELSREFAFEVLERYELDQVA